MGVAGLEERVQWELPDEWAETGCVRGVRRLHHAIRRGEDDRQDDKR